MARVLVVDDDDAIRRLAVEVLREAGHDVEQAANGAEALRMVSGDNPPHCMLVDLMMPVVDGDQFIRLCRQRPGLQNTPVILFSAAREVRKRATELGAQAWLTKPFDVKELEQVVACTLAL